MELIKILCLFITCWQGPIVVIRAWKSLSVKASSFILLALGLTGFIYLQFMI